MNRGTEILCIPGAFAPSLCARVVEAGERLQHEQGTVEDATSGFVTGRVRDSEIAYFPVADAHLDIYRAVGRVMRDSNQRVWRYRISKLEALQYTVYGPGQHYGWHTDTVATSYPPGSGLEGLFRQLSITVQLSDPADYEGGDFEIMPRQLDDDVEIPADARAQGSVIVFPSFMRHRVTPVTGGTRRSLVGWFLGPLYA